MYITYMEPKENHSYLPLNRDQLRALDPEFWTEERIDHQMALWAYQAPSDPEAALAHARGASAYETTIRGLNYDLHAGNITSDQYQLLADEAAKQHSAIK